MRLLVMASDLLIFYTVLFFFFFFLFSFWGCWSWPHICPFSTRSLCHFLFQKKSFFSFWGCWSWPLLSKGFAYFFFACCYCICEGLWSVAFCSYLWFVRGFEALRFCSFLLWLCLPLSIFVFCSFKSASAERRRRGGGAKRDASKPKRPMRPKRKKNPLSTFENTF